MNHTIANVIDTTTAPSQKRLENAHEATFSQHRDGQNGSRPEAADRVGLLVPSFLLRHVGHVDHLARHGHRPGHALPRLEAYLLDGVALLPERHLEVQVLTLSIPQQQ